MKPITGEAQNAKFSCEEGSLLTSLTTFEIFKFENWPPTVRAKAKMDFLDSQGFHGQTQWWNLIPKHLETFAWPAVKVK